MPVPKGANKTEQQSQLDSQVMHSATASVQRVSPTVDELLHPGLAPMPPCYIDLTFDRAGSLKVLSDLGAADSIFHTDELDAICSANHIDKYTMKQPRYFRGASQNARLIATKYAARVPISLNGMIEWLWVK